MRLGMRASWAVPVIASILILGTLVLAQEAFAAINIERFPSLIDPIFKPMNFSVTNTGKEGIIITGITIQLDQDTDLKRLQPFTFDFLKLLKPGESFFFAPELQTIKGDAVEIRKRTLVSVTAEEDQPNPRDPNNPRKKMVVGNKAI